MKISAVMDELAEAVRSVPSLSGRVYPYPIDSIVAPAAFIPFPTVDYHNAYQRGQDTLSMSVVVLVDRLSDRSDRDRVVAYMDGDGAESIVESVEQYTYTTVDYVVVDQVSSTDYPVAGVDYWALVFEVSAVGSGTS